MIVEKPEKFRTSTGFEPVTSRFRCDALTNWAMKPLTLGAGHLWVLMFPWGMNQWWNGIWNESYMNCGYEIKWRSYLHLISYPQFIYDSFHIPFHHWLLKLLLSALIPIKTSKRTLYEQFSEKVKQSWKSKFLKSPSFSVWVSVVWMDERKQPYKGQLTYRCHGNRHWWWQTLSRNFTINEMLPWSIHWVACGTCYRKSEDTELCGIELQSLKNNK